MTTNGDGQKTMNVLDCRQYVLVWDVHASLFAVNGQQLCFQLLDGCLHKFLRRRAAPHVSVAGEMRFD